MKLKPVVIDLETFWNTEHSLSKMSPILYCTHPETEIISCAAKVGDEPTYVTFGENKIKQQTKAFDWSDKIVVGHNLSLFDAMILRWRLGVKPAMWGCTLAMARPLHGLTVGGSLAKLVEHYNLGKKDQSALLQTKGRHLCDFTDEEIEAMREYNKADVEQCAALFKILLPLTPKREMKIIDGTIRMLVEPKFRLDVPLLETALTEERARKRDMLISLATKLGTDGLDDDEMADAIQTELASAPKFSAMLERLGVEVPMKPSPSNPEKQIPALSKTDEEFIALTTHEDPLVAAAASARLGVKSTILESRLEAFLDVAKVTGGRMPIAKNYYGAHTGRFSGAFGLNQENLPRVCGKPSDALRNSLIAPPGHKVVVADLSGIELRVNMYLWQVPYAMALFDADPEKADLYKTLASEVLGVPIEGMPKMTRQAGKAMHLGCFAADTNVLTSNGIKRIIEVLDTDLVWDGESWTAHSGLIYQGVKPTVSYRGVQATSDHEILTEHGWRTWGEVCKNPRLFRSALSLGNLPSSIGSSERGSKRSMGITLGSGVPAGGRALLTGITSREEPPHGVTHARNRLQHDGLNAIGSTLRSFLTTLTALASSIGCAPRLAVATMTQRVLPITAIEGSPCATSGVTTVRPSYGMSSRWMGGMFRNWKWTESTTTKATPPEIYSSLVGSRTQVTAGQSNPSNGVSHILNESLPVYDLLNCGPNNRFTVITDAGPIVVHNCGYGLGSAQKYIGVAKQMAQITVSEEEAKSHIAGYRQKHPEIVAGWKTCNNMLSAIAVGATAEVDPWGLVTTDKEGFVLPSGRKVRYPDLRQEVNDEGRKQWVFGAGRNKGKAYGGLCDENIVQALARDILMDNALEIKKQTGWYPCHTVHDELIYIVPEADAQAMLDTVQTVMRTPPSWFPALKTWSTGDIADTYGEAK